MNDDPGPVRMLEEKAQPADESQEKIVIDIVSNFSSTFSQLPWQYQVSCDATMNTLLASGSRMSC